MSARTVFRTSVFFTDDVNFFFYVLLLLVLVFVLVVVMVMVLRRGWMGKSVLLFKLMMLMMLL